VSGAEFGLRWVVPDPDLKADLFRTRDMEKENLDGVRRLAHSIKGVAGNIGAMDLSRAAAGVEELAANKTLTAASEAFATLRSELATALEGLAEALPGLKADSQSRQSEPGPKGERLEGDKLAASLRELAAALDDDLEAGRSLLATLRPSLETDDAQKLDELLESFDIDGAIATVEIILAHLGQGDATNVLHNPA
jgi:two-component system, sensor histidine kinase and response regulator